MLDLTTAEIEVLVLAGLVKDVPDDGVAQIDDNLEVFVRVEVSAYLFFALCSKILNLNFGKFTQVIFQLLGLQLL